MGTITAGSRQDCACDQRLLDATSPLVPCRRECGNGPNSPVPSKSQLVLCSGLSLHFLVKKAKRKRSSGSPCFIWSSVPSSIFFPIPLQNAQAPHQSDPNATVWKSDLQHGGRSFASALDLALPLLAASVRLVFRSIHKQSVWPLAIFTECVSDQSRRPWLAALFGSV